MRPRPLEIKALVRLLEQEWESPQQLADALIRELDNTRASRTTYVGVMQFPYGGTSGAWYAGVGPYPGRKSAEKALRGDPSASLARAMVVVPLTSPDGLRERIAKYDSPA